MRVFDVLSRVGVQSIVLKTNYAYASSSCTLSKASTEAGRGSRSGGWKQQELPICFMRFLSLKTYGGGRADGGWRHLVIISALVHEGRYSLARGQGESGVLRVTPRRAMWHCWPVTALVVDLGVRIPTDVRCREVSSGRCLAVPYAVVGR